MTPNSIFSSVFLLLVFALTLRTQRTKRDGRIVFLGLLAGLLASIEVLTFILNRPAWLLWLCGIFAVVGCAFLLALTRRSLFVRSKTTILVALGCPFVALAGVSIASRPLSRGSGWQYLADGMSLLVLAAAIILDQVIHEYAMTRADMIGRREFSERLVNSSRDGIFSLDRCDRITLWNPAMELISGTASSAAIGAPPGKVLKHLLPGGGLNPITEAFSGVEITRTWSVPSFHKPGSERVFKGYFSPVRSTTGEVTEVFGVIAEVQVNAGHRAGINMGETACPVEAQEAMPLRS